MDYISKNIKKKEVAVILSFYDGMRFISEQVNSILYQNVSSNINLMLYIRNDQEKSDEETWQFLNSLDKIPNVVVLPSSGKNFGIQNSFLELLRFAEADYYFFSDQDDVWMNDKIDRILSIFENNDMKYIEEPTLIYSDVQLIDANGDDLEIQFEDYVRDRSNNRLEDRIFYDNVTGAAMAINRKLRDIIIRIEPELFGMVHMHDSAISKLASLSGNIVYLPMKLLKYRQHDKNIIGMGKGRPFKFGITNFFKKVQYLSNHLNQAQLMIKTLDKTELTFENADLLNLILETDNRGLFNKLKRGYQLSKYIEGFLNKTLVILLKLKE